MKTTRLRCDIAFDGLQSKESAYKPVGLDRYDIQLPKFFVDATGMDMVDILAAASILCR